MKINDFTAAREAAGRPKALKKALTLAAKRATAEQRNRELATSLDQIDKVLAGGRVRHAPAGGSLGDILRRQLAASGSAGNFLAKRAPVRAGELTVCGYAVLFNTKTDSGESTTREAIEKAWPAFVASGGQLRQMHQPGVVGSIEKATLDQQGMWLRARISDRAAADKAREGVLRGFSLGFKFAKGEKSSAGVISGMTLEEISICDRPAMPGCTFSIVNQ